MTRAGADLGRYGKYFLAKRGDSPFYYIRWVKGRGTTSISTKTSDLDVARQCLINFASQRNVERRGRTMEVEWVALADILFKQAKGSAKQRGLEFDINTDDVYDQIAMNDFRCSVSGIRFDITRGMTSDGKRNAWLPTIDRIDCSDGYVRGNIRVVCLAANIAMNEWGYDTLLRLSNAVAIKANSFAPVLGQMSEIPE